MSEVEVLEEERDNLRRELRATQEMLYQVLREVGQPVIVPKETMNTGVETGDQISVELDVDAEAFIFQIVQVENASA